MATRSNPHTRPEDEDVKRAATARRARRKHGALSASTRRPPDAAIGNGNQVVNHQFIAEQVGVDAFAPGLNGLNGGRFQQPTDAHRHPFRQAQQPTAQPGMAEVAFRITFTSRRPARRAVRFPLISDMR